MNLSISKIICLINLVFLTQSFFSKNHKRCRIVGNKSEPSRFPVQRLPLYSTQYPQRQFTRITEKIEYQELQFIYDKYVAAGGSGEVFQIEEQKTGETRILKRFFKENQFEFQQQNFIMKEMDYPMKWHKQDNNPNKSTLASYPSKDSANLKDLEVQNQKQSAVLFYKICKQIEKAHKKGIIHNDLKMGNILINSIGQGLSTLQVQLIDWNLASFYTKGYQTVDKKGTICYYPPEALIRTNYITPAIDIWALAVVYFTFLTSKKPFTVNCKDDNFEAILSLVSSKRFLQVFQKYHFASLSEVSLIEEIKKNKFLYQGISLSDRIPEQFQKMFDEQMIDLFQKMLEVDPEYRLTIVDVLKHPFFDRIKKLPKMYVEKNKGKEEKKQKQDNKAKYLKHVPANNLVQALTPSLMKDETNNFDH